MAAQKKVRLYRSESNKVIAGVAGGLAEIAEIDATLIRIGFLLLFVFGGSGLLIYIILWLVMPSKSDLGTKSEDVIRKNADEMKTSAEVMAKRAKGSDARSLIGLAIVFMGVVFLLQNYGYNFINLDKTWPLFIIVVGIVILSKK